MQIGPVDRAQELLKDTTNFLGDRADACVWGSHQVSICRQILPAYYVSIYFAHIQLATMLCCVYNASMVRLYLFRSHASIMRLYCFLFCAFIVCPNASIIFQSAPEIVDSAALKNTIF